MIGFGGLTIPIPLTTVGAGYGLQDNLTLHGHLHTTSLLYGTLQMDAGATYALLFAYVGSSFAGIQYSIDPLLYTLVGGAGTVLGPLLGSFLMFYIIDIASDHTPAYLLIAGVVLIILILYFPRGILGTLREKHLRWLP